MRLVDFDALMKSFYAVLGAAPCELNGYEILEVLNAQERIDAIPVGWLEKKRENLILAAMVHSTVYGDNSIELCHAVNVVLDMWQKEQEAR